MARKEQNKILDDKIESNVNQYKGDRLNEEISAFSSGNLNKYEFLTRKDLNYKPNALDKARFELFPLGQTFSTGLDKTVPNYQEEGIIKLLKDIRDGLAGGIRPINPGALPGPRALPRPGGSDRPDDDDDDDDDEQKRLSKLLGDLRTNEGNEEFRNESKEDKLDKFVNDNDDKVFNVLNKFKNNIESEMSNLDKMVKVKENKWSSKLNKLNNDVKKLDNHIKENNDKKINTEKELEIVENKRNNLLLKYSQSNEELNRTKNELYKTKDKLDKAGNDVNKKAKYIDELKEIEEKFNDQNNEVKKLESELKEKNKNINKLKNVLNKFNDKMENDMSNLDKMFTDKENKWSTKLDELNNNVKKLDNYIKENNDKKINTEKELEIIENERDNLLLKYSQSNEELNRTKNELYKT